MEEVEVKRANPFETTLPDEQDVTIYSHGIPPEKVDLIKQQKADLEKRVNNGGEAVTLDEFKEIVIPWLRIHRTEAFILNKPKEKEKKVREPKEPKAPRQPKAPKPPKEKKLTKKEIEKILNACIMKKALGQPLSEEEQAFFDEQTQVKIV